VSTWNSLRAYAKSTSQLPKIHLCAQIYLATILRHLSITMTIVVRRRSVDQLSRAFPKNVSAVEPLGVYKVELELEFPY
jgi:hypothetical protein